MKHSNFVKIFLLTLASVTAFTETAFDVNPFLVINNGQSVLVFNEHRAQKPAIKLSLHGGARILKSEQVSQNNESSKTYTLKLSDQSSVKLVAEEKKKSNVKEYYLQWNGGGPNNGRELCFHTDFNNATW